MRTFCAAVSAVNGGNGGRFIFTSSMSVPKKRDRDRSTPGTGAGMDLSLRCRPRRRLNAAQRRSHSKPLLGFINDAAHAVAGMRQVVNHADGLSYRHVRYIVVADARRRLNLFQFVSPHGLQLVFLAMPLFDEFIL